MKKYKKIILMILLVFVLLTPFNIKALDIIGSEFNLIYLICLVPITFLIISIIILIKYGIDYKIKSKVEFYPPKGLNSLEVGYLYKGYANEKDIASLLIYLANKGYIKISEYYDETLLIKEQSFKITKIKKYDDNNIDEDIFLSNLFKRKDNDEDDEDYSKRKNKNEITEYDLYYKLFGTKNRILTNINDKTNEEAIMEETSFDKRKIIIFMVVILYIIMLFPIYNKIDLLGFLMYLLFTIPNLLLFTIETLITADNNSDKSYKLYKIVFSTAFSIAIWYFFLGEVIFNQMNLIFCLINLFCIMCMFICIYYMQKRSKYGAEMFAKIKGFKKFINTAKKKELEDIVSKEPKYFYEILPYAYALGISDKLIKKFKNISLKSPDWYEGFSEFDTVTFCNFINKTISSITDKL